MNQRLSDWANVAEIVSGIAVVVTLVFLIAGIRENTEITRASMYADHLASFDQLGRDLYRDPELTRINEAWLQADLSGLDALDLQRLEQIRVNLFRTYERAYLAQQDGLYGVDEAERMQRLTCINYMRAVGTETTGFLDVLMTSGFAEHVRSTCPEVMLTYMDERVRSLYDAGAIDRQRFGQVWQRRITAFARAHPDWYQTWQEHQGSFSDSFNTWFSEILTPIVEE